MVALRAKTSASPAPPVTAPKRDERSRSPEYTGVSVLNARGGYTDKEKSVLITAVKIQEAAFITAAVKETDPKAFSVITGADEIIGEGFRY